MRSIRPKTEALSRRQLLRMSALGVGGAALLGAGPHTGDSQPGHSQENAARRGFAVAHDANSTVGEYNVSIFDPMRYLREFDYGKTTALPDGTTLREFHIFAADRTIEIAPGVTFEAWTYNGQVPGPTLRAREGDLVRVHFVNGSAHPHTIHFHGFHPAEMDGVFEIVDSGGSFTYEFRAEPFGLHLYHCHVMPLKRHIHKGLYGVFIVDPAQGRPEADELVMVMNAFDTDGDGENEFYAVNTQAFYYFHHPIKISKGKLIRVYLVNLTEFDLINSFHTHATFFDVYSTGTRLEPDAYTDTIVLGQAERAILEFSYRWPGRYLFHAHVSEFAELGWTGTFEVE
jgi:FtsP/CotA-like multicopper oxidase with cupredoxin domain